MKKQMASRSVTFAAVAFAMCFLGAAGAGRAAPAAAEPENVKRFEEKMQQVQRNPGGIQESVVMDLLGLGRRSGFPGPDGPDRLVGDDSILELSICQPLKAFQELCLHAGDGFPGFPFFKNFSHTDNRIQA